MGGAGAMRAKGFVFAMPKPDWPSEGMGLYSESSFTGLIEAPTLHNG
jgi:hypothetical protein